jgi:hypothetical protein
MQNLPQKDVEMNPEFALDSTPERRHYFMSQQHEDAVIGAAHRRLKEVKEKLNRLDVEAKRLSEVFKKVGNILYLHAGSLGFQNESFTGPNAVYAMNPADFDMNVLRALISDYRELTVEKDRIEKQLA